MPFEPEHDDRKMAEELGLPAWQGFDFRMPLSGDLLPDGQGYMLVHWGIRTDWDIVMDGEPPWPFASGRRFPDGHPEVFQLWLIQAYRPGHPLAAERRWHPQRGVRDSIVGLEEPHTESDALNAWRGHALIAARLLREPWPRSASLDAFIQHRGRRLAMYCRERGIADPIQLQRPDVAEAIGYASMEALRNACTAKGITPDHIKAEAYRQLRAEIR